MFKIVGVASGGGIRPFNRADPSGGGSSPTRLM
jgi:hypothetical protein